MSLHAFCDRESVYSTAVLTLRTNCREDLARDSVGSNGEAYLFVDNFCLVSKRRCVSLCNRFYVDFYIQKEIMAEV